MQYKIFSLFLVLLISLSVSAQRPLRTSLLGNYDPPTSDIPTTSGVQFNDVWGYTSPMGREIAILGNVKYILFMDITDPTQITEVYRHAPGSVSIWRDFKTYKHYAYGVCDQPSCTEGLMIYDLSTLDCDNQIQVAGQITYPFQRAHNIYIDNENHRLYVAGLSGSTSDLYVYDLSQDSSNPTLIADINFNQVTGTNDNYYVHDVFVRDNIAYCSHGNTGFFIWDMNDLSDPNGTTTSTPTVSLMAFDNYMGYNHSSWVSEDGNYAINAEESPQGEELISIDISDMANGNISKLTEFSHSLEATGIPTPHNPFIRNDYLFLSYYEDGLKVFDYSDPSNPSIYAYYDTYSNNNGSSYSGTNGAWGCYPFFPSGNIVISDIAYGMFVLSVSGLETCADGIQNQDETGVDCGGKYCLPCTTCFDGIQNGDEQGIDCGGNVCCAACPPPMTDCIDDHLVINTDIDSDRSENYKYSVYTQGPVTHQAPYDATYKAGNFLELREGFEIQTGAQLLLMIEACQ